MGTVADKLVYLDETKTAIRDAIAAKGVSVADTDTFRSYATKIGEISGGGGAPATKFGVSIDNILGDVDENGALQKPSVAGALDFSGVREIGSYILNYSFIRNTAIAAVDFGSVTTIGFYGADHAFSYCTGITSVDLSSLITLSGNYALAYAFQNCTGITSVDLSSLTRVEGNYGLGYTFDGCSNIASVDLSSLEFIAYQGAYRAFGNNRQIQTISFPSLTGISSNSFGSISSQYIFYGCSALTEIHFRADMQATIEAMTGYSAKWGATNATIYFDL